jgi:ABC-2 type transport system permease protein
MALGVTPGVFGQCLYLAFGLMVEGLIAMTVAAIASLLAGRSTEAFALSAASLGAVSVATWGTNALMERLLVGNAYGQLLYSRTAAVASSLLKATASFNPLLFFLAPSQAHSSFTQMGNDSHPAGGNWVLPVGWLCVVVALLVIAVLCAGRRKAENAGVAGTLWALCPVVATVFGFGAFTVVFHFLAAVSIAVAVTAAFLIAGLAGMFLSRSLGHSSSFSLGEPGLAISQWVVAGLVLVIILSGGLGYSWRMPDPGNVASVDVSYVGTPNYLAGQVSALSVGRSYYFNATYSFTDSASIALVERVQKSLIKHARTSLELNGADFAATTVPYDVVIAYHEKNGKCLTRYYDRATLSDLGALLALDDSRGVIALEKAVITGQAPDLATAADAGQSTAENAYQSGAIYLADVWYSNPVRIDLSAERRKELLRAIAADVADQPAEARYSPTAGEIGVLMFSGDGEREAESFAYDIDNTLVYLTPDMVNTIRFLKDNHLYGYTVFKGMIQSLTFQKYDPYSGWNKVTRPATQYFMGYRADTADYFWTQEDAGLHLTITDPNRIAALLPALRSTYFMSDGGYLVEAKLAGSNTYVYRYLPAVDTPDFVKNKVM